VRVQTSQTPVYGKSNTVGYFCALAARTRSGFSVPSERNHPAGGSIGYLDGLILQKTGLVGKIIAFNHVVSTLHASRMVKTDA